MFLLSIITVVPKVWVATQTWVAKGQKMGLAVAIQTWIVYFHRYHSLSLSVCGVLESITLK